MTLTGEIYERFGKVVSISATNVIGISFAIACSLSFSSEDLMLYEVSKYFHPTFIFWCNSVVSLCLTAIAAGLIRLKWRPQSCIQFALLLLYGECNTVSQVAMALAVFSIGPGNAVAIFFTLTVFSTFFGVIFIGTKFRIKDLFFAVCSTGGVALISLALQKEVIHKEGFSLPSTFGIFASIIAGIAVAGTLVIGRKLTFYENSHFLVILLFHTCQFTILSTMLCLLFGGWSRPSSLKETALLCGPGVSTFAGISFSYLAVGKAKPTTVSIVLTSEVVMTYIGQFIIFRFPFSLMTLAGSVLIVFACVGSLLSADEDSDMDGVDRPPDNGYEEEPMIKENSP